MKKIMNFILKPYREWQERRKLKKRIKDLKKRDPFIYR